MFIFSFVEPNRIELNIYIYIYIYILWYVTMILHIRFIDPKQFMCIFYLNMVTLYVYTYKTKNIQIIDST